MNSWKVIVATLVIFTAGILTGAMLTNHAVRKQQATRAPASTSRQHPASPNIGGARIDFLCRAAKELQLQPKQQEQVDQILVRSQERTRRIMEPVSPRLRDELQRAKDEFRAVLDPAQQERFDQLLRSPHRPREREPRREKQERAPRPFTN